MTQTIQANGVTAGRDPLTGTWKIDRDSSRNIPQITIVGTRQAEVERATLTSSRPRPQRPGWRSRGSMRNSGSFARNWRSTVTDLAMVQGNCDLRRSEIAKTDLRNRLMRLTSPVAGTVQQLSIHTLGGVVQPAETLLVVAPDDSKLVIEAKIPNREAGFVRTGQSVRVKVDAFPFTDYGTIDGVLEGVSGDAVEDEKLGLVYTARVRIDPTPQQRRNLHLSPGMAVSAEIMTAKRRIIQYLLSPISARLDEAGRER